MVETQHYLQNINNNNNSKKDFLLNINLSVASLHITIYLEVIPDITLKFINLWKIIEKKVLSKQENIIENEINNVNVSILVQAYIQSILVIRTLKLVLNSSSLPNPNSSQLLPNYLLVNTNYKSTTNQIHAVLMLKLLNRLVIEEVFDHIIYNKKRLYVTQKD